ncbi:hypothetical protein JCM8097_000733 [Rhodosporidiobolus ruineniae]
MSEPQAAPTPLSPSTPSSVDHNPKLASTAPAEHDTPMHTDQQPSATTTTDPQPIQPTGDEDEVVASTSRPAFSPPKTASHPVMPFGTSLTKPTDTADASTTAEPSKKRPASPAKEDDDGAASTAGGPATGTEEELKNGNEPPKKKQKKAKGDTVYCHQDHQPHDAATTTVLRCTGQKEVGKKNKVMKKCNIAYCERCLQNRYSESASTIISSGAASTWRCPSCRGICNCSKCRKKDGLESTGPLKKLAGQEQSAAGAPELYNSPVSGGRAAAKKAAAKLASTFTAGGLPAAQSLTREEEEKPTPSKAAAAKGKGKKKEPKPKKEKMDGNGSDSSLSSLTDSEEEEERIKAGPSTFKPKAVKKPKAVPAPKKDKDTDKTASASPAPSGPKRVNPPRAPPKLPPAPKTLALSSSYFPSAVLPPTSSLLARLHLREFLLRFLRLIPSLRPRGNKTPQGQHARVLSALADDVLWLWRDHDLAAETVQLTLLQGLVELLLAEKRSTGAIGKLQREALETALEEVKAARDSGSGKTRDRPWVSVVEALESSEWIGRGYEWVEEMKKKRRDVGGEDEEMEGAKEGEEEEGENGAAGAAAAVDEDDVDDASSEDVKPKPTSSAKGKGKAKAPPSDKDSDLSSLSSASSSSSDDGDEYQDEDDEVDQLASDYDSEADRQRREFHEAKQGGSGRRGKFERETPAEERLALCCGLVDLAVQTELVREDMAQRTEETRVKQIELRKKGQQQRKDLAETKEELKKSKPEKPAGNNASSSVKEWKEECERVDEQIKDAEERVVKEGLRIQHDIYLSSLHSRLRFTPVGTDALGQTYYLFSPPPPELLENPTSSASSGFPVNRTAVHDEQGRDYPLSWAVLVHGKRPGTGPSTSTSSSSPPPAITASPERAAASKAAAKLATSASSTPSTPLEASAAAVATLEALDASSADEWYLVHGLEGVEALATYVDATYRHAQFAVALAEHYVAHPFDPAASKTHRTKAEIAQIKALVASDEELERRKKRVERADVDLGDAMRQKAGYLRWTREKALDDAEAGGVKRVLRGEK